MRWFLAAFLLGAPMIYTFDKDEVGKPPAGFEFATTSKTPDGKWVVQKDGDRQVLAQLDKDVTSKRYAMAVAKEGTYKDLKLSVQGKPVSGTVDQAVGLVWRYKDSENYYVARSNALEENVRLYKVVAGKRTQIAGKDEVKIAENAWHALRIEHRGETIQVFLNDQALFEGKDAAIAEAGKVGVWIKADSVTFFDDLSVEELK